MPPIIRNILIRLTAFFERVLRGLSGGLKGLSGSLAKLLSLDGSNYYIEDDARTIQSEQSPPLLEKNQARSLPAESTQSLTPKSVADSRSTRRRSDGETDYFRNMARQIKRD